MRILVEASGSLTSQYLINAIQQAGHTAVASDISADIPARYLADDFIQMPKTSDRALWEKTTQLLKQHRIEAVIPTLDDSLYGWAERADIYRAAGIYVMLSSPNAIRLCTDKWLTYQYFTANNLPMPATSLSQNYPLIKPRNGRGSCGVRVEHTPVDMTGNISQQLLQGKEYTVDVLVNAEGKPVSIVPRVRSMVKEGKSVTGVVEVSDNINELINRICQYITFKGPINVQLFDDPEKGLMVVEINPRLGGGTALAFAATTNWIPALIDIFTSDTCPAIPAVKNGMKMYRYYAEYFVS